MTIHFVQQEMVHWQEQAFYVWHLMFGQFLLLLYDLFFFFLLFKKMFDFATYTVGKIQ